MNVYYSFFLKNDLLLFFFMYRALLPAPKLSFHPIFIPPLKFKTKGPKVRGRRKEKNPFYSPLNFRMSLCFSLDNEIIRLDSSDSRHRTHDLSG
jgi:hypothetical protein